MGRWLGHRQMPKQRLPPSHKPACEGLDAWGRAMRWDLNKAPCQPHAPFPSEGPKLAEPPGSELPVGNGGWL